LLDALNSAGDFIAHIFGGFISALGKGGTWLLDHVGKPLLDFFGALPLAMYDPMTGKANFLDTIFADLVKGLGAGGTWLEDHIWTPISNFFDGLADRISGV